MHTRPQHRDSSEYSDVPDLMPCINKELHACCVKHCNLPPTIDSHRMVFEGTSFLPLRLNLGSSHPKSSLLALFVKAAKPPEGRVLVFAAAAVLLFIFVLLPPAPAFPSPAVPGLPLLSSSVHTPPDKHKPAGILGSAQRQH